MIVKGDAFWLKGTGGAVNPGASHLFCVLTNVCPDGEHLVANVTSRRIGAAFDQACLLDVGDHDDIKHASYMLYERARTLTQKQYDVWKFGHQVTKTTSFAPKVLDRICAGVQTSTFAVPRIKKYYLACSEL